MTYGLTHFFGNTIINHVLRSASIPGSECRIGLFHYIDETFAGSSASEIGDNAYDYYTNYHRLDLTGSWTVSACRATMTTASAAFPPVYFPWGYAYYFGVGTGSGRDDKGDIYFYGEVSPCRAPMRDDLFVIYSGNLYVTLPNYEEYLADSLLEHYLNDVNYPSPKEDIYVSLFKDDGNEVSGSVGYCRIPWGGSGSWTEPVTGSTMNTGSLIFTYQSPLDWGWITDVKIYDSGSGGNLLYTLPLSGSVYIEQDDSFIIDTGKLRIFAR